MDDLRRDIHNLQTFSLLTYANVRDNSRRHRFHSHAKIYYDIIRAKGFKFLFDDKHTRSSCLTFSWNEHDIHRYRYTNQHALTENGDCVDSCIHQGGKVVSSEEVYFQIVDCENNAKCFVYSKDMDCADASIDKVESFVNA